MSVSEMQKILAIVLMLLLAVTAKYEPKSEEDFFSASERCMQRDALPNEYKQKFDAYEYPDEPAVHKFLHCVWSNLGLWDDRNGFNVEHVADLYKDRANAEVLVPILADCNLNKNKESPTKWCYNGFICMLNSRVGQWFKDDLNAKRAN